MPSQNTVKESRESDDIEAESLKLSWGAQMSMPSGQAAESSLRKFSDLPQAKTQPPQPTIEFSRRLHLASLSQKLEGMCKRKWQKGQAVKGFWSLVVDGLVDAEVLLEQLTLVVRPSDPDHTAAHVLRQPAAPIPT